MANPKPRVRKQGGILVKSSDFGFIITLGSPLTSCLTLDELCNFSVLVSPPMPIPWVIIRVQ